MLAYPAFATEDDYRVHFTNVDFWQPYIREVCIQQGFVPQAIRPGAWGTNPVYIADTDAGRVVIKLFTALFGGRTGAWQETEVYRLLMGVPDIPAPSVLALGELFAGHPDWSWPYLIVSVIPGSSLGDVRDQVSHADLISLARALGLIVRHIHAFPIDSAAMRASHQRFMPFLRRQRATCVERHRKWNVLSSPLIAQLEDYLPHADHVDSLLDRTGLNLGHNDLNHDHVLGEFDAAGRWRANGIIDFGDADVCDRLYDLAVIHHGLFLGDKTLLSAFLGAYGADEGMRDRFVYRAMCYTLLHRFPLLNDDGALQAHAAHATSLDALADEVWRI